MGKMFSVALFWMITLTISLAAANALLISPRSLNLKQRSFLIYFMLTRQEGKLNMRIKEQFTCRHLWIRSIENRLKRHDHKQEAVLPSLLNNWEVLVSTPCACKCFSALAPILTLTWLVLFFGYVCAYTNLDMLSVSTILLECVGSFEVCSFRDGSRGGEKGDYSPPSLSLLAVICSRFFVVEVIFFLFLISSKDDQRR